jgi:hypothetical protein
MALAKCRFKAETKRQQHDGRGEQVAWQILARIWHGFKLLNDHSSSYVRATNLATPLPRAGSGAVAVGRGQSGRQSPVRMFWPRAPTPPSRAEFFPNL